jgi:hypothetical protein
MSQAQPTERAEILSQVDDELAALLAAGEVGTITVHCGVNQLLVEVNRKREPIKRRNLSVIRQDRNGNAVVSMPKRAYDK